MTPHYADDWLTVYHGDARTVLAELPAESVHCVVTSPPYWGLRDYGTASWEGGDEACDHVADPSRTKKFGNPAFNENRPSRESTKTEGYYFDKVCGRCGATRQDSQLGLEPTPEQYVENMVAVFREVRRVLRSDGTVWLNLGSSFAAAGGSGPSQSRQPERAPAYGSDGTERQGSTAPGSSYSDLCDGCRVALSPRSLDTLRSLDGAASPHWPTDRDSEPPGFAPASPAASPLAAPVSTSLRSSLPPRASCSHCGNCGACLSVLRSSSRDAQECVRKPWLNYTTFKQKDLVPIPWMVAMALQADGWYLRRDVIWSKPNPMPESVTDRPTSSHEYLFLLSKSARYYYDADAVREGYSNGIDAAKPWAANGGVRNVGGRTDGLARGTAPEWEPSAAGRNLRSVWTIATQPYPGAHFATFPPKLVEPCIKAGTSEKGVCGECGAPWRRITEVIPGDRDDSTRGDSGKVRRGMPAIPEKGWESERRFVAWASPAFGCGHKDATVAPATVLDPFAGSGTTGMVAQSLSRRAVLIDLSMDYLDQLLRRNRDIPLGLGA